MTRLTHSQPWSALKGLAALLCCLTLCCAFPGALTAQDDCCEYATLRYENSTEDGKCCFKLYLDVDPGSPCEFIGYQMWVYGLDTDISVLDYGSFVTSVSGSVMTWNGCFKEGSNYLGTVCIGTGAANSWTLITSYFNAETQKWVGCPDAVEIHCAIDAGSLSGTKYLDQNCNGIKDENEPGLEGWTIKIINKDNNQTQTAVTDVNGNYSFTGLDLAPWYVYELQQAGWAQTAPPLGHYYIVLSDGDDIVNLDFGNIPICEEPESETYLAGSKDDFGGTPDDPPASPSEELAEYLSGRSLVGFDNSSNNRFFAHSFTGYAKDNCCLVGAQLTIRLKANTGYTQNDGIAFVEDGAVAYYNRFENMVPSWPPTGAATVVLDLGDLTETFRGTSVLPAMLDGTLDLYIQDDTQIDWMELTVDYCCPVDCCEFLTPLGKNNLEGGDCCFDLQFEVEEEMPCEISAVRMTVANPGTDIEYTGDGSHDYAINGQQIVVTLSQNATPGIIDLGTYCFTSFPQYQSYAVLFEYFDENTGEWINCNKIITLECLIDEGSICGTKFNDLNCNGVQDPGETGIGDWEINIRNAANGVTLSVTTDADGNYKFQGLEFATWSVYETQQSGWSQTFPASGAYLVTLQSSIPVEDLDFGNVQICKNPVVTQYQAGEIGDVWTLATPSDELREFLEGRSPIVGFGNETPNRHFAHSFTDFQQIIDNGCCIVGATLTFQASTNDDWLSHNDNLVFVQDGQVIYSRRIGDLAGGILWRDQPPTVITVDLGNLTPGRTTSILPSLLDGQLDFYVQDDTRIDWALLDITFCCEGGGVPSPVDEIPQLKSSLLTPNPATETLNFDFSLEQAGNLDIVIVNNLGQIVVAMDPQLFESGSHSLNFDVQNLPQGAYFVRVGSNNAWSSTLPFSIVR